MNLLQIIKDHALATNNKSGLSIIQIAARAGISISAARPILKELLNQGSIIARKGINNTLFFSNPT